MSLWDVLGYSPIIGLFSQTLLQKRPCEKVFCTTTLLLACLLASLIMNYLCGENVMHMRSFT